MKKRKPKKLNNSNWKLIFFKVLCKVLHYRKLIVIVSHDDSNDNDDDKKEISCTRHDSKDIQIDISVCPPTKDIVLIFFYSKASKTEKYEHYEHQYLLLTIYLIDMLCDDLPAQQTWKRTFYSLDLKV